jgi:carbon monoxide dehydrogenase subunit G
MPSVSETTTIAAPIGEVWPLLSDPALVAACIPGATLAADQSDGIWRGAIRVKFGPTVAQFRGEATLAYDHTAKTCSIEGKGIDQRGASRALASGVVKASPNGEQTDLKVDGEFSVTGPLETFANAGGVHVARALLGEFSANMAKMVAERQPQAAAAPAAVPASPAAPPTAETPSPAPAAPTPPAAAVPAPKAAEISAGRILWLALKSWLSSLFRKRT